MVLNFHRLSQEHGLGAEYNTSAVTLQFFFLIRMLSGGLN